MLNVHSSRLSRESSNSSTSRSVRPPMWKNPALYKSRLCDSWINGVDCRYGLHCWFAHGPHELRKLPFLRNDSAAKTQALAEVVGSLPYDFGGRQYANAAYATEYARSLAPNPSIRVMSPPPSNSFGNQLVVSTSQNQFHYSSHFVNPQPFQSIGPSAPFHQSAPQFVQTNPVGPLVDSLLAPLMNRDYLYV